jgi:hypothetical protein
VIIHSGFLQVLKVAMMLKVFNGIIFLYDARLFFLEDLITVVSLMSPNILIISLLLWEMHIQLDSGQLKGLVNVHNLTNLMF